METKFTKGEWKALKTGLNETCIFSDIDMKHIFKITHNEVSKMQSDANAKLIEAAPDMFNSLKELLAQVKQFTQGNIGEQDYFRDEISNAQKSLNKATGLIF